MRADMSIELTSASLATRRIVASVTPNIGDTAGGIPITITGSRLKSVTGVTIGGTACTSVVSVSDTTVTCVTPAKTVGTYDVKVLTLGGTGTLVNGFDSWDPVAAFGSNAFSHFDSKIGVSKDGSNNLTGWTDQGGLSTLDSIANTTVASDGGVDAVVLAGPASGKFKVTYAGSIAQPCAHWLVVKVTAPTSTNVLIDGIDGNRQQVVATKVGSPRYWQMYAGAGPINGSERVDWSQYQIVRALWGATDTLTINGSATPDVSGNAGSAGSAGMWVGASNAGAAISYPGPIYFRSITAVSGAVAASQIALMERYLSARWQVSLVA